jgi:hypothetical protein
MGAAVGEVDPILRIAELNAPAETAAEFGRDEEGCARGDSRTMLPLFASPQDLAGFQASQADKQHRRLVGMGRLDSEFRSRLTSYSFW